ncbi:thiamine phosphate synthase [Lentisphaera profundi]|uniref:Thiamine phosphate synthase n=1 Tax=Lentisphaera profundi TaxID=1658616 RepID=A0ABY7VTZ4_9BACT|nr:thiamine phosphate synthase [Lentisphaera profundi]WDE97517.1 thiamine phosphate synthase [Lentisphaera profundi]
MNDALLKANEAYWIYDYTVAGKWDKDGSLLKSLSPGLKLIQIRIKELAGDALFDQAKKYFEIIKASNPDCQVIMNDHIDLCQEMGMDGVHLGQGDDSIVSAREILGESKIIGLTVRSLTEAKVAQDLIEAGVLDYVGVGTVFETTTKQGLQAKGPEFIKDVFTLIEANKVYPIGGINKDNIHLLKAVGVHHVAICSELYKDPILDNYRGQA